MSDARGHSFLALACTVGQPRESIDATRARSPGFQEGGNEDADSAVNRSILFDYLLGVDRELRLLSDDARRFLRRKASPRLILEDAARNKQEGGEPIKKV
ncbi:uncharacterized protein UTRI_03711 [Ustilago trichophora]|uniref:Uncharacterized protein n=1 Tax=Ustilago trichophora TaxID=86804 RepID=A0A5C3E159_9BASI|nr:uncharacterized protein UTRI_03711 [Ustilago trichophora]